MVNIQRRGRDHGLFKVHSTVSYLSEETEINHENLKQNRSSPDRDSNPKSPENEAGTVDLITT